VNDFSHELPELAIPADETIASGEYERTKQAQQFLTDGNRALKNKDAQTGLDFAKKAEALNPGFYQNSFLEGRALLALDRKSEASLALEKALAEQPAFLKEKQELEDLLRQTKGAN
jgi:hypothetical protein